MFLLKKEVAFIILQFLFGGVALAGIDDVWNSSPPTNDSYWSHHNALPVNPGHSVSEKPKMKLTYYSGGGGCGSNGTRGLGWHAWCVVSTNEPCSDRATGTYLTPNDSSASETRYWTMDSYHVSRWQVTCYDYQ
jgi:hypothetical protein